MTDIRVPVGRLSRLQYRSPDQNIVPLTDDFFFHLPVGLQQFGAIQVFICFRYPFEIMPPHSRWYLAASPLENRSKHVAND